MSQVAHKEALYEIFTAKMATGESLYGNCDAILKTNISKLKSNVDKFICLSDYVVVPVPSGKLKDKFVVVQQDIICGGVVYEDKTDGEVTAEWWGSELARLVRSILRGNQSLVSASYPNGAAKRSYIGEAAQEFVLYYDTTCCIHTITLELHVEEVT